MLAITAGPDEYRLPAMLDAPRPADSLALVPVAPRSAPTDRASNFVIGQLSFKNSSTPQNTGRPNYVKSLFSAPTGVNGARHAGA